MLSLSKMPLRDLLKRKEALERELAAVAPALWQELTLVRQLIDNYDSAGEKPYAKVRRPGEVILLCLERNRAWMTRDQIKHELEVGGFSIDNPITFNGLLAAALRFHWSRGTILRRDEHGKLLRAGLHTKHDRYPNERFGLPAWAKDNSIPDLDQK